MNFFALYFISERELRVLLVEHGDPIPLVLLSARSRLTFRGMKHEQQRKKRELRAG